MKVGSRFLADTITPQNLGRAVDEAAAVRSGEGPMLQFRFPASKVGSLGRGATAALRTLNPLIQVRILAPQLMTSRMS
jgi:hypothetical protein